MSGDEPELESGNNDTSQRARLAIALGAALLLAAIVIVVVATGGSEDDEASELLAGTCFVTWNEDLVAPRQDGIHAYTSHGYRQTLVTRIDREGGIIGLGDDSTPPDDPEARCAVIFASPQVDMEPDFGVRVFDQNVRGEDSGWTGLSLADTTPLEQIEALQAEAVSESNTLLLSNGTLGPG